MKGNTWGKIVVINLSGCDKKLLKDISRLSMFPKLICSEIGMKTHGEAMIERFGKGNLKGNSMLQFIETSSISVHLDEVGGRAFIDIFSCKEFDSKKAVQFSMIYFKAEKCRSKTMYR